jgi:hypothetical protein
MAAGRAQLNGQWERGHLVEAEPEDVCFDVVALPPAPICAACFHPPCPCCPLPWCDRLQPGCCEDVCEIDRQDFEVWKAERDPLFPDPEQDNAAGVQVAEGPWFPTAVRRARGVL